jgi:hypothetical protein
MNTSSIIKSTQEQAVASWIDHLNQFRVDELLGKLISQDANLANALNVLAELKLDVSALIDSNRGGEKGLHGFIAERAQVSLENARKLIDGLKTEYILVDDNSPVDLLRNGIPIQQKFSAANWSLNAIRIHIEKYPDFVKNGGKYQIPKDFYAMLEKYATMPTEQRDELLETELFRYNLVQKFLNESGVNFDDIEPAVVNYRDVYKDSIYETIDKETDDIRGTDQNRRYQFHEESKPTLQEGMKATAVSAVVEGGVTFCLGVVKKRRSGKKFSEFTEQDWNDIGLDTTKGVGKGAVRGASVYALTNFTATPAAVASSLVTASFGVMSQAQLLHLGKITAEEFIVNSEVVCLDVTVSAIASFMGQAMIPVPVLGAVIGNAVGMFMYGIAKDNLSEQEQALIYEYCERLETLNEKLDASYKIHVEQIKKEFGKFKSVVEFAFDVNVNVAFAGSVSLAHHVGCSEEKILKSKIEVDTFFLE